MPEISRIVVSCMDRRLSSFLDLTYNDGKTVFVRNAGANITTALNTIKQLSIEFPVKEIVLVPHTDCGAMGLVAAAIAGKAVSPQVEECLVAQFRNRQFSDRDELEKNVNGRIQKAAIGPFAKSIGAKVEVALVDLLGLDIPKDSGRHLLSITKPSPTKYRDFISRYSDAPGIFDSYFIQANGIKDVLPDIEIAASALHIHDIRLVSESSLHDVIIANDVKVLKQQNYLEEAKISTVNR